MDIIVISPGEKHHKSDIAIVSSDTELIKDSSFWKMIIGYDVIVPVISKRPIF